MDHGANVQSREDSKQEGRFTHYQCYVGVSLGNDNVCAVSESVTTFLLEKGFLLLSLFLPDHRS